MKFRIPIFITASLLTWSCEKQEESKSAPVVTTPAAQPGPRNQVAPKPEAEPPAPPVVASKPPVPPPTEEEVQTFLADLEKLAEEVAKLPQDATPTPEVDAMQNSYTALIKRRGTLMAGMNEEQKRKLLQAVAPSAKVISPTLIKLRLAKVRDRMKTQSPQPGLPQPASPLDNLSPGETAPPPEPPAPPTEQPAPQ